MSLLCKAYMSLYSFRVLLKIKNKFYSINNCIFMYQFSKKKDLSFQKFLMQKLSHSEKILRLNFFYLIVCSMVNYRETHRNQILVHCNSK